MLVFSCGVLSRMHTIAAPTERARFIVGVHVQQAKETASRVGVGESILAACRLQQDDAIAAACADVRALCSARDRLLRVCGAYHVGRCNRRRRPCRSACRATPTALRMPLSVAHHKACYRCTAHCYLRCTRILLSVTRTCAAFGFLWGIAVPMTLQFCVCRLVVRHRSGAVQVLRLLTMCIG